MKDLTSKKKNGYYLQGDLYFGSVTKILSAVGGKEGLLRWACARGGYGVIWALADIKMQDAHEKLGSPACLEWAKEQALASLSAEQRRTSDFGKNVHDGIEAILTKAGLDFISSFSAEEKLAVKTFDDFYKDLSKKVLKVEEEIFSKIFKFAGRTDLICEFSEEDLVKIRPFLNRGAEVMKPGIYVCDFKTGKVYKKEQGMQLSAYAQAYKEETGKECIGALIINIERENPSQLSCVSFSKETLDESFVHFQHAIKIWEYLEAPQWYLKQFKEETCLNL